MGNIKMMNTKKLLLSGAMISFLVEQSMALDQLPPENRLHHNAVIPEINDRANNNDDKSLQIATAMVTGQENGDAMDAEFWANFNRLSSLFTTDETDDQLRQAIYNIAEKNVIDLVSACPQPQRVALIIALNDILMSLPGEDKEERSTRTRIFHKLHDMYPQDRATKILTMAPLMKICILKSVDKNTSAEITADFLTSYGKQKYLNQFRIFINAMENLVGKMESIENMMILLTAMKEAIEINPDGLEIARIMELMSPIFQNNRRNEVVRIIPYLLKIPQDQQGHMIDHLCPFPGSLVNILEALIQTPETERADLIKNVILLQSNTAIKLNDYAIDQIFESLSQSPVDRRSIVISRIIDIGTHQKKIQVPDYLQIIPLLRDTPDDMWEKLLRDSLPIMESVGVYYALEIVSQIEPEWRQKALTRYETLIKKIKNISTKGLFSNYKNYELFETIAYTIKTTDDEWENILSHSMPFMNIVNDLFEATYIIKTLYLIPEDKRKSVCKKFFHSTPTFKEMIGEISPFPLAVGLNADQLIQLPNLLIELFSDITREKRDLYVKQLLYKLSTIPPKKRFNILYFAQPYFKNFSNLYARQSFMKGLCFFKSKEIPETLAQMGPILNRIEKNHVNFVSAISLIPEKERADIVAVINVLIQNISLDIINDGMVYQCIIENIANIPPTERISIAILMEEYLAKIPFLETRIEFMLALQSIDVKNRKTVLSDCTPLFQSISDGNREIVTAINNIPPAQRSAEISEAIKIFNNSPDHKDGFWLADILTVRNAFKRFGRDENADPTSYLSFLSTIAEQKTINLHHNNTQNHRPQETMNKLQKRRYVMSALNGLFFESLNNSIHVLKNLKEQDPILYNRMYLSPVILIEHLRSVDAIEMDGLLNYWKNLFQTNPHEATVKSFADYVTQYYHCFGLLQNDDVVQQAIRAGILLEQSRDPLNPYNVFKELTAKRQDPIDWTVIQPRIDVWEERSFHVNPVFLAEDLPQFNRTASDMPSYTEQFIDICVKNMDQRLIDDPSLVHEISNRTGFSYDQLKDDGLRDGILHRLLKKNATPEERIDIMKARFIAIGAYIESLSSARGENDILSPQEEAFLRMLASIQGCPNGKAEGINAYYLNILPVENRYSAKVFSGDEDIAYLRSKSEVTAILSEEIEKMFSGQNDLMKEIVGLKKAEDEVIQASHQAGYLKNLIGHAVGLPDQLLFDAHTQMLYVHLVHISKQEALAAFFKHFSTLGFVKRISEKYDIEEDFAIEMLSNMGMLDIRQ